ncbi:MAG: nuclear transport factor 2 family protein [Chlorobi bacterium]|nr:nuclear transport factor 2 family protein [Chlorobiota bacterium]
MKKFYFLLIFLFLIASGCSKKNDTYNQDSSDLVLAVEQIANQYFEAWNNKDLTKLNQLTADDGEFYGSDPEEIMDKTALLDMYSQFFADTTNSYLYNVDLRKIKVSSTGNSALIMERITFPAWSPKMPMVQTSHLTLVADEWIIDFISWGFIIKNDDVPKVNEIL